MVFVCLLSITSGCTQQKSSTNPPPSTESLQTILAKATTIESMYYEISITREMPGVPIPNSILKVWEKTQYLKEEMITTINGNTTDDIYIERPEGMYQYDETEHKYNPAPMVIMPEQSVGDIMQNLLPRNQSLTNLGNDIIFGKSATLIQYAMPTSNNVSMTVKMWLWDEKGVPLKVVTTIIKNDTNITTGPRQLIMTYVYSNYSFSDIPDSTFSVQ